MLTIARVCELHLLAYYLLTLAASSGSVDNGKVSVCPSVCLSLPSIDSQYAAATCSSAAALPQPGRGRQISIDRYLSAGPTAPAGSVNAVSRGGSAQTCLCVCVKADSQAEMDGWIDAGHLSCAASYARHLGRDGTAKLLRAEIHKLENSIDLVSVSR